MTSESTQDRPRLLVIFPGVQYDLEHNFKERFEGLSRYFRGGIFCPAVTAQRQQFGDFTLQTVPGESGSKLTDTRRFFKEGRRFARELSRSLGGLDLVVTYDPLKSGLMGSAIARELGAKFAPEINGDYLDAENFTDIGNPVVRKLKALVFPIVMRFVLRRSDGAKTLFPGQLRGLAPLPGGGPVVHFPDYCDARAFHPGESSNTILFAGFPFIRKGVDILIAAFRSVATDFPDWKLNIIGWFPDRSQLDAAIDGHPGITVHPPCHRREMPGHVADCAFLVLPSRSEAMGRVLIEAMAAAKPRIGTRVGGIPTLIDHEQDGLLVAAESVEELAAAMRRLMEDPELRTRLGEAGQQRYAAKVTNECYYEQLNAFYLDVLSR